MLSFRRARAFQSLGTTGILRRTDRARDVGGLATVKMLASNYDDTLTLRIDGKPVQLGRAAAAKVWVGPLV